MRQGRCQGRGGVGGGWTEHLVDGGAGQARRLAACGCRREARWVFPRRTDRAQALDWAVASSGAARGRPPGRLGARRRARIWSLAATGASPHNQHAPYPSGRGRPDPDACVSRTVYPPQRPPV